MARVKPNGIVINDIAAADEALRELAGIERSLAAIEADMNQELEDIRATAALKTAPFAERQEELNQALKAFTVLKSAEIFDGDKKSRDLNHGTIGFRLSTSVKLMPKVTWGMVMAKCKELALLDGIRVKEEPNKELMRETWPAERLALVGVKRDSENKFFYETRQEELPEKGAA